MTQCCYDEPLSYKSSETLLRKYNEASKLLDMLSDNHQLTETITAQWHSIKAANGSISNTSTFQTRPHDPSNSAQNAAMETNEEDDKLPFELSQDIIHHLQSIYLTWQWPLHCFVERKQLISTLNEEKVRFTCPLLLFTILAHASRFSSRDASPSFLSMHDLTKMQQFFLSKAKALLYKKIEDKPSSQGVSAILMLASRQVANASFNQAWIFAGIAIRMLQELEIICFDGTKCTFRLQYLTDEIPGVDRIDARRAWHLYQSCYTFDKTLSFGLGKTPSLQQSNEMSNSMESLENSSELDEDLYWPDISQPNEAQSLSDHDRSTIMTTSYLPRAHHPHRTFTAWYRLSVIFGSILATEETPLKRPLPSEEVKNFAKQLRFWKETLPSCINIPHPEMEEVSPPPNIVTLNVVYHTCTILPYGSDLKPSTYAPTIVSETSFASSTLSPSSFSPEMLLNVSPLGGDYGKENTRMLCTKAAIEIHKLLKLWARTFTFDRMTWLFGCCIYTYQSNTNLIIHTPSDMPQH